MWRALLVIGFVLGCAWRTSVNVPIWTSDVTLWGHAVEVTPEKPRPWLNYGVALAQVHRYQDSTSAFASAYRYSERPYLAAWEYTDVRAAVQHNLDALSYLTGGRQ